MTLVNTSEENKKKNDAGAVLKKVFKKYWNKTFVINSKDNTKFSFGEIFLMAKEYGATLYRKGLKEGDTIVVVASNSLELLLLYFATMLGGIKIVPLDSSVGSEYLKEIISLVSPKLIIFEGSVSLFPYSSIKMSDLKVERKKIGESEIDETTVNLDAPWLITFTSGTTGIPKGVIHTGANLIASAQAYSKEFSFTNENIFYHNLPMTYMAGILNLIFLPFVSGSAIILAERFSIESISKFWDLPAKYMANVFWFTPTILAFLMKLDRGKTGICYTKKIDAIGCVCTAPLYLELKESFENRYALPLYESYGLSETLFVTTNSPRISYLPNSVGKALEGVKISTLENEILVEAPWMFLKYLNLDTCSYFIDGKFRTGDVGELRDGYLWITGRKKYLINRGGVKISPFMIERIVATTSFFKDFAIIGVPDEIMGEKIVCVYVSDEKGISPSNKRTINLKIKEKLGRDFTIDMFVEVPEIPRTTSGKVDIERIKKILAKMRI